MLFASDAVSERFPGEMTLYVVPLHTIVPWLPFTGSADAGAAIRRMASRALAANARPSATEPSLLYAVIPTLRHADLGVNVPRNEQFWLGESPVARCA